MHYPPSHHQEDNYDNIIQLMQDYPLATIISSVNDHIESSHTPLIYKPGKGFGELIGHLDKFNPQLTHFQQNQQVKIIFNGPEVYISPSVYGTTQLPTWNYFKAHLNGRLIIVNDEEKVKESLVNMTSFLEGEQARYQLNPDNPRMAKALDYIVGFRIEINSWEGKYKISQDKRKDDQQRAKKAMIEAANKNEKAIDNLYRLHQTKSRE